MVASPLVACAKFNWYELNKSLLYEPPCSDTDRTDRTQIRKAAKWCIQTPAETWHATKLFEPIPAKAAAYPTHTPHICVQRSRFGSDANLPVVKITVHRLAA
jgi:hypothetical protein